MITTIFPTLVNAQQSNNIIKYGDTVSGNITNRKFEIPYDFKGKKGDIVLIEMSQVDIAGDLQSPEIILLNESGDVVGDTSGRFLIFGSTVLATQLKSDGTYTILATRSDGRAGNGIGEFTLKLIQPTLLELDKTLKDTTSNSDSPKYYLIRGESDPLYLLFHKTGGEYSPEFSINIIDEGFDLTSIIKFSGSDLGKILVSLPTERKLFIVKIEKQIIDFSYGDLSINYELLTTTDQKAPSDGQAAYSQNKQFELVNATLLSLFHQQTA